MILLFGTQKSGTTWLRNILGNFTPANVTTEWQLPYLVGAIENHITTLGHASPATSRKTELECVRAAFSALLAEIPACSLDKSAYPCIPELGSDNRRFPHAVDMGRYFFPEAKQVMIVRDPRDIFVSSTYFWPNLSIRAMNSFDDDYLIEFIDNWSRRNLKWLAAKRDYIIRYEKSET